MKKIIGITALILLTISTLTAQYQEYKELEHFTDIELDGNIRLYLRQGEETALTVKARKAWQVAEYDFEVIGSTLYIRQTNDWNNRTPKIKVYLEHMGIDFIEADGFVKISTQNTLQGESFTLKGDGFIKGAIEVDVINLRVQLDGLCSMIVSGAANQADLTLDGMGRINAEHLLADDISKSAEGLAGIRIDD